MFDKSFQDAIKETKVNLTDLIIISKMKYTMSFGEFTIQYDFHLN